MATCRLITPNDLIHPVPPLRQTMPFGPDWQSSGDIGHIRLEVNRSGGWDHIGDVYRAPGQWETTCGHWSSSKIGAMIGLQEMAFQREQQIYWIHYVEYGRIYNKVVRQMLDNQIPSYEPDIPAHV